MAQVKNIYSDRANERRKQFNNIVNGMNMILMNNIPEVDPTVWENSDDLLTTPCDIENGKCNTHEVETDEEYECDEFHELEVYQWFAVGDSDADFLKRHGQYITYSDLLDTYFLAICHCGTSWDYVDSMVEAFSDCYHGLEEFSDDKE